MNRVLFVLAITLFPLTAMGQVPDARLVNPLEVCDELPASVRADWLASAGTKPTHRSWWQRLWRPRFSAACPEVEG